MVTKTMSPDRFEMLVHAHGLRGKSREACYQVLVEGASAYRAAQELGLARSTVSRALKKLSAPICPRCGQPVK